MKRAYLTEIVHLGRETQGAVTLDGGIIIAARPLFLRRMLARLLRRANGRNNDEMKRR